MNCKKPLRGKKGNRAVLLVLKMLQNVGELWCEWDRKMLQNVGSMMTLCK